MRTVYNEVSIRFTELLPGDITKFKAIRNEDSVITDTLPDPVSWVQVKYTDDDIPESAALTFESGDQERHPALAFAKVYIPTTEK